VPFAHGFEYYTVDTCTINDLSGFHKKILFSTYAPFNFYLNESDKIQFNPEIFNQGSRPFAEQFNSLTDSAKAWISYETIRNYYYTNIDLDYKLIFCNPEKFIDDLFNILDTINLTYTKNKEYCYLSIENYKKTCINPRSVIGNLEDIYWLAWCHGLVMLNKIPLTGNFDFLNAQNIQEIAEILTPVQITCMDITKSLCFFWENS
jgi:hypothetical protein